MSCFKPRTSCPAILCTVVTSCFRMAASFKTSAVPVIQTLNISISQRSERHRNGEFSVNTLLAWRHVDPISSASSHIWQRMMFESMWYPSKLCTTSRRSTSSLCVYCTPTKLSRNGKHWYKYPTARIHVGFYYRAVLSESCGHCSFCKLHRLILRLT